MVDKSKIIIRSPLKYNHPSPTFTTPPLEWLQHTWSVTHSTLPMWKKAKNVRITYKIIPSTSPHAAPLLDDEVTSTPTSKTWLPQPKSIQGIDTPDGDGAWNWRGKGWLKIASSHWEVLGWGEREIAEGLGMGEKERWVVTWFAPSLFTPQGLDIYSSRREGLSEGTYKEVKQALEEMEAADLGELVKKDMFEVKIEY
ncbi:hypothetical protein OCU04_005105 [Sclerotinia nivalis]|uniref:Uncharacterized protein n=1 Tax=Sclerotinia nivalis TaxID=352851 RepID=A0A9X0ANI3_9HELO|nr:hypothetical protein OCU04_005105 [Sclerotinia nivalis]